VIPISISVDSVVVEVGMDPDAVRPILGAKLRALDAISEN
jgi:hypothetical protein